MTEKYMILETINIEPLVKATAIFNDFSQNLTTDQEKAGAVQAFEFCYELSWKILKKVLAKKGVDVASPRDTFRAAALNKLISAPEPWFDFQQKRNLTVHTYNQETVAEIISVFPLFANSLDELLTRIQKTES